MADLVSRANGYAATALDAALATDTTSGVVTVYTGGQPVAHPTLTLIPFSAVLTLVTPAGTTLTLAASTNAVLELVSSEGTTLTLTPPASPVLTVDLNLVGAP